MLKKDLLVTLHLRIRVVVPKDLKAKARREWERRKVAVKKRREERGRLRVLGGGGEDEKTNKKSKKEEAYVGRGRKRRPAIMDEEEEDGEEKAKEDSIFEESQSPPWLSLSPKSIRQSTRRGSSGRDAKPILADLTEPPIAEESGDLELDDDDAEIEESEGGRGEEDFDLEQGELEFESKEGEREDRVSSIVIDPGRATYKERQWLEAMSEGKDPVIARRFQQYVFLTSARSFCCLLAIVQCSWTTLML